MSEHTVIIRGVGVDHVFNYLETQKENFSGSGYSFTYNIEIPQDMDDMVIVKFEVFKDENS